MKNLFAAIILGVALIAGNAAAEAPDTVQNNAMTEVNHRFFDTLLVAENIDTEAQQTVYIAALDLTETVVKYHRTNRLTENGQWVLTEEDKLGLQALYYKAMEKQFGEKYDIVDTADAADIVVEAKITELAPNAPKDTAKTRDTWVEYYTEGAGKVTGVINVIQHDTVIVDIHDTADAGRVWEQNNAMTNRKNVRNVFNKWAADLVDVI